jgi:hypothetical protein
MAVCKGVRRNIKNFNVRICMPAVLFICNTNKVKIIAVTAVTYITLMGGMKDKRH